MPRHIICFVGTFALWVHLRYVLRLFCHPQKQIGDLQSQTCPILIIKRIKSLRSNNNLLPTPDSNLSFLIIFWDLDIQPKESTYERTQLKTSMDLPSLSKVPGYNIYIAG